MVVTLFTVGPTDVFRNIVIIADIRLLLCLNNYCRPILRTY